MIYSQFEYLGMGKIMVKQQLFTYQIVIFVQELSSADYLTLKNQDLLLASVQLLIGCFQLTKEEVITVLQFVG